MSKDDREDEKYNRLPQLGLVPRFLGRTRREWWIIGAFLVVLLIQKYLGSFIPVSPVLVTLLAALVCRWFWVARPDGDYPEYWLGGKLERFKLFARGFQRMSWGK